MTKVPFKLRWIVFWFRVKLFWHQLTLDWVDSITFGGVIFLFCKFIFPDQPRDLSTESETISFFTEHIQSIELGVVLLFSLLVVPATKLMTEKSTNFSNRWKRFRDTLQSNPKSAAAFLLYHIIIFSNKAEKTLNRIIKGPGKRNFWENIVHAFRGEKYILSGKIGRPEYLANNIHQIWGLKDGKALLNILEFDPIAIKKKLRKLLQGDDPEIRHQVQDLLENTERIKNVTITAAALDILSTLGTGKLMREVFYQCLQLKKLEDKIELLNLIDKGRGTSLRKLLDITTDEPDEFEKQLHLSEEAESKRKALTEIAAEELVKHLKSKSSLDLKFLTTGYSSAVLEALERAKQSGVGIAQVYVVQASQKPIDEDYEMDDSLRTRGISSLLISPADIPFLKVEVCIFGFEMASVNGFIYHPRFSNDALVAISNAAAKNSFSDVIAIGESWKVRSIISSDVDYSRVIEFRPGKLDVIITDCGAETKTKGRFELASVENSWQDNLSCL